MKYQDYLKRQHWMLQMFKYRLFNHKDPIIRAAARIEFAQVIAARKDEDRKESMGEGSFTSGDALERMSTRIKNLKQND